MRHIFRVALIIWILNSYAFSQDTIRGTYSYTYGDKESLVDARQTCKDLAIREAIESYSIFIQSSTSVENFQLKEDAVTSIAVGVLKNVQIVEQKEEGRTITMTVEAMVNPDEVKKQIEQLVQARQANLQTAQTDSTLTSTAENEKGKDFLAVLAEYQKRMGSVQDSWGQKKFDSASDRLQESQQFLEKYQPDKNDPFQMMMVQSMSTYSRLLRETFRAESLGTRGKPIRTKTSLKMVKREADRLRDEVGNMEKLTNLDDTQKIILVKWISRCRQTLTKVKEQLAVN